MTFRISLNPCVLAEITKRALRRKRQKDLRCDLEILADAGQVATTGMSNWARDRRVRSLKASGAWAWRTPGRQDDFMRRLRLMDFPIFDVFDPDSPVTVEQQPIGPRSVTRVKRSVPDGPVSGTESGRLRRFP